MLLRLARVPRLRSGNWNEPCLVLPTSLHPSVLVVAGKLCRSAAYEFRGMVLLLLLLLFFGVRRSYLLFAVVICLVHLVPVVMPQEHSTCILNRDATSR